MNFKEWSDKYYPKEDKATLQKMSHAWAASKVTSAKATCTCPHGEGCFFNKNGVCIEDVLPRPDQKEAQ